MKLRRFAFVAILLAHSIAIFGQQTYRLPQIANGRFPGGIFRTTFIVFNVTDSRVTVNLALSTDDGSPLRVTFPGFEPNDKFTFSIEAGEMRRLQTDGSGAALAGAAIVTATGAIGVSAIFSLFDEQGNFLTEAGVGSSELLTDFLIPVDISPAFNTGLALFNDARGTSVTLRLLNPAGAEVATAAVSLEPNGHMARFLAGAGEFFPQLGTFRGMLAVTSTAPVAAIALRQNTSPLSLTTLPATARAGAQVEFNLAQVANGTFSDGTIRTSFVIFSRSAATVTASLSLTRDDGSPLSVNIPGLGRGSLFTSTLPPGGSVFYQTDGLGDPASGGARVSSSGPVGVSAVFSISDSKGRLVTEAGVADSTALNRFSIPVEVNANFDTGAAFFNRGSTAVTLNETVLDRAGSILGARTEILPAGGHAAQFVSELFPSLVAGEESAGPKREFRGSLIVSASSPIAAVALRQNRFPLSLTTLPVAPGASQGHPLGPVPLLRQSVSGVDVTQDIAVNAVLSPGLRLSGVVQGPTNSVLVAVRGDKNSFFAGSVNPDTGRYALVVPPDRYRFLLCYEPDPLVPTSTVRTAFDDPDPIQVAADTMRDIVLPTVAMMPVSGFVSGLASIPSLGSPALVLNSNDGQVGATLRLAADGSYQGRVPASEYTASFAGQIDAGPGASSRQILSIFGIGSARVAGTTAANFTIPATAKLSGTVRGPELAGGPPAVLSASDTSVPNLPLGCASTSSISSIAALEPSRTYQMTLASGRTYAVQLVLPAVQGAESNGSLGLPVPARLVPLPGTSTQDFDIPPLPPRFILSGRVTDAGGGPVAAALVSATTTEVSGITGAFFSVSTRTGTDGTYRMPVLSGTNYQLSFSPVIPSP